MFIPLRTDRPPRRRPVVTESLIVANLVVYLVGLMSQFSGLANFDQILAWTHFDPQAFRVHQLLTYQFMHDPTSVMHVAFNMLFLWIFGAAVEDRLGRLGFLGFYLGAGVVAGLGHMLASSATVIGASGSVSGVTGAFIALFPRSRVKVLLFFFLIGVFNIPSLWFVGFKVAMDLFGQASQLLGGGSNVAYAAHLGGYAYGFAVGFTLLATGVLKHEDFDVFYLFRQSRRRKSFRAATRETGGAMWDAGSAKPAESTPTSKKAVRQTDAERSATSLRRSIGLRLDQGDLAGAAAQYRELLATGELADLPEQRHLDVANQLFAEGDFGSAALAYERFIDGHDSSARRDEVALLLALVQMRHLGKPDLARSLLESTRPRLADPEQQGLADQLLAELSA